MAYCNSTKFGVFDLDAVWFETEPGVTQSIGRAQVLTLSDSRLQSALSLGGAPQWFAARNVRAYFLGLPGAESGFGELLVDKLKPRPAVAIFDTSPYFTGSIGPYVTTMLADAEARKRQAQDLKGFQDEHQAFCAHAAWACALNFSYFRSRDDGHWIFPDADAPIWLGRGNVPSEARRFPAVFAHDEMTNHYPQYLAAAKKLTEKLGIAPHCIVITHVPAEKSSSELAVFLADNLGFTLIAPDVSSLATFDRAHLTPDSSRRWAEEFLRRLEPVLQSCIPPV